MTPLVDQAAEYAADRAAPGSSADIAIRRAFMFGALCVLEQIIARDRTPRQLLDECSAYGRTIGTAAEGAS